MDFKEYQKKAVTTAIYPGRDEPLGLMYTVLGLTNEAGEVAGKLKKFTRDGGYGVNHGRITEEERTILKKELGDVLWYVAMAAHELGLDLNHVAELNIAKLASRKERGQIRGSGDNR